MSRNNLISEIQIVYKKQSIIRIGMQKHLQLVNTITDLAPLIVITFAGYQVITESLSVGTMVAFVALH